ncbi:hypothetical protein GCM10009836_44250 [Pseudonocardia ailaonensis]|uniref:SnoaL-like domain-containing protein n=1 Tax=Pseudonocardia ailaonensis TaxID=367279 RepID=A0ABN2NAB8_9PSEU
MDIREKLIREWFGALGAREFDRLPDLLTDDAEMLLVHWDQESVNAHTTVEYDNPLVGRAAIVALYTRSADIFSRLTFDIDLVHLVEGGDRAVVEYRSDGIAASTGKPYRNTYCAIFEFRDGQIRLWKEYHDPAEYDRAFSKD